MEKLFSRIIRTSETKSMQVTELPIDGIHIEGITIAEEGIIGSRMALSSDSAKALLKMLKEWEREFLS